MEIPALADRIATWLVADLKAKRISRIDGEIIRGACCLLASGHGASQDVEMLQALTTRRVVEKCS